MDRIATASNLLIEAQPEGWRLLLNGNGDRTLLEAKRGEPIRYTELFGTRRKLPMNGQLPLEEVERVVLGWSPKDEAWHLGLVLHGSLVDSRGSRWCELAHWIDPDRTAYERIAVAAGESLAAQIARPFVLIPPIVQAPPPPPPLPPLPLQFDLWTFEQSGEGRYEFVRSPKWARSNILRALWYALGVAAFLILSVTSLTSRIAFPRPELLVPAGFVCAFVLLIGAVALFVRTFTRPNRIVIAPDAIRWQRGAAVRKSMPLSDVQSVYASHVTSKAKRLSRKDVENGVQAQRTVHYGELNIELRNGQFQPVVTHGLIEDRIPASDDPLDVENVTPLTPYNCHTPLQAAGLMLGERLRVPVFFDRRVR